MKLKPLLRGSHETRHFAPSVQPALLAAFQDSPIGEVVSGICSDPGDTQINQSNEDIG
jgi:hypothetical protein